MPSYDRLFHQALREHTWALQQAGMSKDAAFAERCRVLAMINNKKQKKPPEAGLPVPASLPNGPLPLQGGAEAPLNFERE